MTTHMYQIKGLIYLNTLCIIWYSRINSHSKGMLLHVIPNIYKYYLSRSPSPPAVTNGVSPPAGQLTPLTQGQLVEAINFLLEHDQDFVTKIHQAYVMSLTRRLTAK